MCRGAELAIPSPWLGVCMQLTGCPIPLLLAARLMCYAQIGVGMSSQTFPFPTDPPSGGWATPSASEVCLSIQVSLCFRKHTIKWQVNNMTGWERGRGQKEKAFYCNTFNITPFSLFFEPGIPHFHSTQEPAQYVAWSWVGERKWWIKELWFT